MVEREYVPAAIPALRVALYLDGADLTDMERAVAAGRRLDIPAGTAVRFEPGEAKTVALVEIAGNRIVRGGLL